MTIRPLPGQTSSPSTDLEPTLDHLVYAATDLEDAVAQFEAATGIRPAYGGRHAGRGTRNHLVRLGERSYLEIIGPDLDGPVPTGVGLPFGIEGLAGPSLLTWAVHPPDIAGAARASARVGAELGAPMWMKRQTPSGRTLEWRIASVVPLPFSGVTPFLIDWGDSTHPSSDPDLPGARLLSLSATHPDPAGPLEVLKALGLTLPVTSGASRLVAVLDTPRGLVTLT